MVVERKEMQEVVESYTEPICLNIGTHSALDAWQGQRMRARIHSPGFHILVSCGHARMKKVNRQLFLNSRFHSHVLFL
jgi:hypothetical protein